jgi:acyl-ACP thioesterase
MEGRVVSVTRNIGLADVRPDSTARLDALARVVQDVADADAATAGVDMGIWILRRMELHVVRTPRLRAEVLARTWCSGVGPRWAERRTQMHVNDVSCVESTAIWVHTDPLTGAPRALPPGFDDLWGVSAHGRKVSARLRHLPPPAGARRARWPLRATDLDVVGHVNNAAYWAAAEEELARRGWPRVTTAEIEFRAGLDLGESVDCVVCATEEPAGFAMWLCVDGDVRASMLIGCEP